MRNYFTDSRTVCGSFYTDLAIERRRADTNAAGIEYKTSECEGGFWECVRVYSEEGARSIDRPIGNYDTLNTGKMELLSEDGILDATEAVAKKLCERVDGVGAFADRLLIVGLGNRNLTPDSIGPRTTELINATLHIAAHEPELFSAFECAKVAVCSPGVMSKSGMEASDVIMGICERISPDAVIAIDSLAARSPSRLGSTIQISDTGIFPGSGIGNRRSPINQKTTGIPVIAIGIPTVINARALTGSFSGSENEIPHDMFVSQREIDEIVEIGAKIISESINRAFGIS